MDQKSVPGLYLDEALKELKKRSHHSALPIEEKEGIWWVESLEHSTNYPNLKEVRACKKNCVPVNSQLRYRG